MAYVFTDPVLGRPPITSHRLSTESPGRTTPWKLGDVATATDPTYGTGRFIYLKGVASTVAGSWVIYNADDWSTTLLVANAIGPVAIAMSACVASEYGWYQIVGKAFAKAADVADNASVFIDTVAGQCDDAAITGDRVWGATWASDDDTATGLAEVEIANPFVNDALNAGTS